MDILEWIVFYGERVTLKIIWQNVSDETAAVVTQLTAWHTYAHIVVLLLVTDPGINDSGPLGITPCSLQCYCRASMALFENCVISPWLSRPQHLAQSFRIN